MSNGTEKDPADLFREWVTNWERTIDSMSNQFMDNDDFSRTVNKVQASQLQFQKMFGDAMGQHLANLNMPNRQEVQQISEGMRELATRLERVESKLDKILSSSAGDSARQAGPPRTKKPPSRKKAAK